MSIRTITYLVLLVALGLTACGSEDKGASTPHFQVVVSDTPVPVTQIPPTPTLAPTALPLQGPGIRLIVNDINDENNLAESLAAAVPPRWLAPEGAPAEYTLNITVSKQGLSPCQYSGDGTTVTQTRATVAASVALMKAEQPAVEPLYLSGHGKECGTVLIQGTGLPDGTNILYEPEYTVPTFTFWLFDALKHDPVFSANLPVLLPHPYRVFDGWFSPDGTILATRSQDGIYLWETETGKSIRVLGNGMMEQVTFSPDGKRLMASSSSSPTVRFWDITSDSPDPAYSLTVSSSGVSKVQYSPDGSLILTVDSGKNLFLWDATTGKRVRQIWEGIPVRTASFNHDGNRLLVVPFWEPGPSNGPHETKFTVWDVPTGEIVLTLENSPQMKAAMYTPDGSRILTTGQDQGIQVWDAETGEPGVHLPVNLTNLLWNVYVSADSSKLLILSAANKVEIWDLVTGEQIYQQPYQLIVQHARFSPDGQTIIVGGDDGTLRVWNIATGQEHLILENTIAPLDLAVSPDGRWCLTTSADGLARLWNLSVE